jgi:hypothetical protein
VKSGKLNFEEPRQIEPWTCFGRYPVRASAGALYTWVESLHELRGSSTKIPHVSLKVKLNTHMLTSASVSTAFTLYS